MALALGACGGDSAPDARAVEPLDPNPAIEQLTVSIDASIPHDAGAYTQGLVRVGERLYESTGRYGRSELRELDPDSDRVLRSVSLDDRFFGEGLAHVSDRLIQLTWREGVALRYDVVTFDPVDEWAYDGEGWGLCFDGAQLVMSDGSSILTFRNADSFAVERSIGVTHDGSPVRFINELECVGDAVYANIWRTDQIIRIDPATGAVEAVIDASPLPRPASAGVLNGIAYDPERDRFRLTGKNWPTSYDVEFVPLSD